MSKGSVSKVKNGIGIEVAGVIKGFIKIASFSVLARVVTRP
jgi:hypothetical protein